MLRQAVGLGLWVAIGLAGCAKGESSTDPMVQGAGGAAAKGGASGDGGAAGGAGSGGNGGAAGLGGKGGAAGSSGNSGAAGSGGNGGAAGSGGAGGSSGGSGIAGAAGVGGAGGTAGTGGTAGGSGTGGAGGAGGPAGGAGAGGTGAASGSGGSPCLSYSNDLDTSTQSQEWTPGSTQVGTQWGQFGHHWGWGVPATGPQADHTGGGSLWSNRLTGKYAFFENSHLESPTWNLSAASAATLSFWHWLELEWCDSGCGDGNPEPTALDGANVVCFDGSGWILAPPSGGYPGVVRIWDSMITPDHPMKGEPGFRYDPSNSAYNPAWRQVMIPLPAACLRADAKVRFRFGSDSSDSSMNGRGWHIDDIALVATCP